MHINPKVKTYAGQPARISQVTKGGGRKLYALKTCGGTVATAFDTPAALQKYANKKLLRLGKHEKRDEEMTMSKTNPMQEVIRDALSPEAVALAASELLLARCDDEEVDLEVRWFAEQLIDLLGGDEAFSQTCKGIGL